MAAPSAHGRPRPPRARRRRDRASRPLRRKVAANEPSGGRPSTGVSPGAPTASKWAGVRFSAEAVITPTLLPFSLLICSSAEVATGTGDSARAPSDKARGSRSSSTARPRPRPPAPRHWPSAPPARAAGRDAPATASSGPMPLHGAEDHREVERRRIADVALDPRKARIEHQDAEGSHGWERATPVALMSVQRCATGVARSQQRS